jgi:hypothetical protein
MPIAFRLAAIAGAIILTALIIRAVPMADLFAAFAEVGANPWGLVGLADLYLGFILFAAVIAGFEPRRAVAVAWIIGLFVLGNLVSAVWLVLNHRRLWQALRQASAA